MINKLLLTIFIVLVWVLWMMLGGNAHAQGQLVQQGAPGNYGPWKVTLVPGADGGGTGGGGGGGAVTVSFDGGTVQTTPQVCTTSSHKTTSVGTSAVSTPSTQLLNRRYVTLCSSPQNPGVPLVKCRVDGVAPVMASGNPGDVLAPGDCATYAIAATSVPACIADTASTNVLSYECL